MASDCKSDGTRFHGGSNPPLPSNIMGANVSKKNQYRVKKIIDGEIISHSSHDNWTWAEIQRDDILRKKGVSAWIEYRGHIVEEDVKKIKPMKEGI
jgi:hypothetical protein